MRKWRKRRSKRQRNRSTLPDGASLARRTNLKDVIIALHVVDACCVVIIIATVCYACFYVSCMLVLLKCVCVCFAVVGGCVGYRNNKAFVQMIVYGMIGLALVTGIFAYGVKRSAEVDPPSIVRVLSELILCVVYLCFFFAFRLFSRVSLKFLHL